jgi:hypothetical protein
MMTEKKPRGYRVAVYFRDDDGIWHYHGTWEDDAVDVADAKAKAINALADDRIEGWKAEIIGRTPVGGP